MIFERELLSKKKKLSERDMSYLKCLRKTLDEKKNLFLSDDTYIVFTRIYPEVASMEKSAVTDGYVIYKGKS